MSDDADQVPAPRETFDRVRMVINPASGSVGNSAPTEARALLDSHGLEAEIIVAEPGGVPEALQQAFADQPSLILLLAGDGTARAAASQAGPDGPVIAPLPGGTMNMLPRAVYGVTDWKRALNETLQNPVIKGVPGGKLDDEAFYVAAILGSPALWAYAREAMRKGDLRLAWMRGQRALKRAFSGRVRFQADGGEVVRAEAVTLMSPLVSRAVDDKDGLEVAMLDVKDARAAFRLAARTAISEWLGDWRDDPDVHITRACAARVWAHGRVPAILDGEPVRFDKAVTVSYRADAFRALAPGGKPPADPAAA